MREAIASLFLYLLKIYHMKLINFLLIALVFVSSCKEEEEAVPLFDKNYGDGMYIATDNGVSFYKDGVLSNNIFQKVNGITLNNVNKIKFQGTKAYIATEKSLFSAKVETFESNGEVAGFMNLVDFDFVPMERIFAVDKDNSNVMVVDINRMEIISDVEVGLGAEPVFIISKWYRSLIMNGGEVADSLKDSTIVAIDYRDELVPFANMMGSIEVGDNPNSAIFINELKILCKGIYDINNLSNNTFSSLSKVSPWDMELVWNVSLGVYNAKNLTSNSSGSVLFFTANDGVYNMYNDGTSINNIISIESDVLLVKTELYAVNDTTNDYSTMFYINDAVNNPNTIYKFNQATDLFCDTIVVDSPVKDIAFY
tara:strand:- start:13820 stop:14923 length:1104 start_codon:yes stop_codon:yes gene_type:complete